ncbi:glucose-1-phosphate adenylyltransferase [Gemmatirosa kalamazoonensis]|uniref:Glucose-1-phosphate adenylyltransferase n=1 Tax=Gemmatirosa kalamazoonensis TaxID=861299 RepID=W0RF35_9BACT|nr:glucose-1-phosphate adenylyltransferase [Gemmatirosa kalamazoonensis]AHG88950.1 glucose-1-phosphate adenylyltransferase [Gemmatirosa kalamazoonensis]
MNRVIALILGGGAGTRLFPLTRHRAKPAVPLAGKYRLIDVPISNCINSGLDRIFVLTQFNSASLNNHIARSYVFDRFRGGFVTILAAEQTPSSEKWFQGTADAVRQSLLHIVGYPHDHVIILSGDQLYTMDYQVMLDHHKQTGADITIAATPVTAEEVPGFGILKTDGEGRITEFYEKPPLSQIGGKDSPVPPDMERAGRRYLASMGIYVFGSDVLRNALDAHPDQHDFGKEIIPGAITERRVVAYPFTGYWNDIGTVRSFFETHIMLGQPHPEFNLYDARMPLYTNARMLPPAKLTRSRVSDSIIGEGSVIIDADVSNSVVGIRSYLAHQTKLHRVIFMGADYYGWAGPEATGRVQDAPSYPGVGEGSRIENAIVDKNVSIGRNCVITNTRGVQEGEGPGFYIRDGIVVILKNATIADGTII